MDTLITLQEASHRYDIPLDDLRHLADRGKIPALRFKGEILVVDNGDMQRVLEELGLREQFDHLRGSELGITEAARKYGLPQPTVSRWVRAGFITTLGQDGQKTLVDEADVAYCEAVYRYQDGGKGKRIFDKDGSPYRTRS